MIEGKKVRTEEMLSGEDELKYLDERWGGAFKRGNRF